MDGLRMVRMALCTASLLVCTLAVGPVALGEGTPSVVTTVSDVQGTTLSGLPSAPRSKALVTYTVTQQPATDVPAGTVLPSATVDRAANPAAFDGLWGGSGFLAAWMAPKGSFGAFEPEADLVENIRFRNRVKPNGGTVPAGSSWRFAMAQLGWDAPTPFDRAPSANPGVLGYETAVATREISATSAGNSTSLDAAFFRADIVARGGDVDARSGLVYGPVIVDLGRPFASSALSYSGAAATISASYINGFNIQFFPSAGKIAIYANLKGVIREAREHTLPSGVTVNEWHLPIMGVVAAGPLDTSQFEARVGLGTSSDGLTRPVAIAAAGAIPPEGVHLPRLSTPGPSETTSTGLVGEMTRASDIDATLAESVELTLGNGNWGFRLNPDLRGEGVLALESVRRTRGVPTLAGVLAIPAVETANGTVRLDRSRLRDLRVMPVMPDGRWYLGASGGPSVGEAMWGRILDHHGAWPALQVEAVYELGPGLEALVMFTGRHPMPQAHLGRALSAGVLVRTKDGTRVPARPIQYLELPGTDPVRYDGEIQQSEFRAPLDLTGSHRLSMGGLSIEPSFGTSGFEGVASVIRAPADLIDPGVDPSRSITGRRVALVLKAPNDLPHGSVPDLPAVSGGYGPWIAAATSLGWIDAPNGLPRDTLGFSFLRVQASPLTSSPSPKPIGTPCGTPQVSDIGLDDADPSFDLKTAWLDADEANLYATMQVRSLPTASPSGQTHDYVFQWRHEHIGYYARAALDSTGTWRYDFGYAQSFDFFKVADVTGDVKPGGNGLVRIAVPRSAFDVPDGQPLRFTSAWTQLGQGTTAATKDYAPEGSTTRGYGAGADYLVGSC